MVEGWVASQFVNERRQARVLRVVTKAAVLVHFKAVFFREKRQHERERGTQVEVACTDTGVQVRAGCVKQRSRGVQCEAHETKELAIQTEENKAKGGAVEVQTQTRRVRSKSQAQQTGTPDSEVNREVNPTEGKSVSQMKEETKATAVRKRRLEVEMKGHCGSIGETEDNKLKTSIQERMRVIKEGLDVNPEMTSLLLVRMVKKQMEIRSKEPKIPWG